MSSPSTSSPGMSKSGWGTSVLEASHSASHLWSSFTEGEAEDLERHVLSPRVQNILSGTQLTRGKTQTRARAVLPKL